MIIHMSTIDVDKSGGPHYPQDLPSKKKRKHEEKTEQLFGKAVPNQDAAPAKKIKEEVTVVTSTQSTPSNIFGSQIANIKQGFLLLPLPDGSTQKIDVTYEKSFGFYNWLSSFISNSVRFETDTAGSGFYVSKQDMTGFIENHLWNKWKIDNPEIESNITQVFIDILQGLPQISLQPNHTEEEHLQKVETALEQYLNTTDRKLDKDPLNIHQQLKIKEFIDGYILTPKNENTPYVHNNEITDFELIPDAARLVDTLSKKQNRTEETRSKLKTTQKKLHILEKVLDNPAIMAKEFGIDETNHAQIFAAKKFISAILRSAQGSKTSTYTFISVYESYKNKMVTRGHTRGLKRDMISLKNQLLMENDPLLSPTKVQTDLDRIFANFFFQNPQNSTISRENIREDIKNVLQELFEKEQLKPVLCALITLIQKEKAQFFMSNHLTTPYELTFPYLPDLGVGGVYANARSVFFGSIIMEIEKESYINPGRVGDFAHESMHMLFNVIVGNESSPVKSGSSEEKMLDQAILADIDHRKSLDQSEFSPMEKYGWATFETNFFDELYFKDGFDPKNKSHMQTARVEVIVRPIEFIAVGASEETVKKFAPNVWKFYKTYSEPLLKQYAQQ